MTTLEATEAPASRTGWVNNLIETHGKTRRNSKERELQVTWVKNKKFWPVLIAVAHQLKFHVFLFLRHFLSNPFGLCPLSDTVQASSLVGMYGHLTCR